MNINELTDTEVNQLIHSVKNVNVKFPEKRHLLVELKMIHQ